MNKDHKQWLEEFSRNLPESDTKNALLAWLEYADEDLTDSQLDALEGLFQNSDQCEKVQKFTEWVKKDRPQKPPHIP